jgi:hypothetical protein
LFVTIECNYYSYSHTFTIAKSLFYARAVTTDSNHFGYVGLLVIVLLWRFDPILFHPVAES